MKYVYMQKIQSFEKSFVIQNANITDFIDPTRTCFAKFDVSNSDKFFCVAKAELEFCNYLISGMTFRNKTVTKTGAGISELNLLTSWYISTEPL